MKDQTIAFFIDYEIDTIWPEDEGEGIIYWWEDMRPREVLKLVKETYERGLQEGFKRGTKTYAETKK